MIAESSQCFPGRPFAELFAKGIRLIGMTTTSRDQLARFLDRVPLDCIQEKVDEAVAEDLTRNLHLTDGTMTVDERIRIAQLRPWIIDATVLLDILPKG